MRNSLLFVLVSLVVCMAVSPVALGEDGLKPEAAPYVRKATWPESMAASLELAEEQGGDVVAPLPNLGGGDFTVMAWIKTKLGGTIFAKAPLEGVWKPQGKTLFVRGGVVNYDIGWVGCVRGRRFVADEHWRHVALVGSNAGRDLKIYVDGRLDVEGNLEAEADPEAFVARIGYTSENFPSPSGFDGVLDEVRVFNVALDEKAIAAYAEAPENADNTPRGQARHLTFEDGDCFSCGECASCGGRLIGGEFVDGRIGQGLKLDGEGHVLLHDDEAETLLDTIWANLERDFQDDALLQEMRWERDDAVWSGWKPGDWSDLADRYAGAMDLEDVDADAVSSIDAVAKVRGAYLDAHRLAERDARLAEWKIAPLRQSIAYLAGESDKHKAYLKELGEIETKLLAAHDMDVSDADVDALLSRLEQLRYDALVAENPLLDVDQLVFVRRPTYQSSHYYTDFIDGCHYFGGNVCVLNLKDKTVRELAPSLAHGIFGRYDLSFDGTKVVFDWKENNDVGFRLYEVNIDGTGLKQLTFPPEDEEERIARYCQREEMNSWAGKPLHYRHFTDDMHPCCLPDGGIAFISTRCEYGILCDGPDVFSTTVLYRIDGDGSNMQKLSNSSVSEATPTVTNDGRILYTRWEYVDKGAVSVKCLWTMNPDGTGSAEVYGNDIADPCTLLFGRPLPGDNNRFVCCGVPHCCPIPGVGTVLRIDTTKNIRTLDPLTYVTPDIRINPTGHNTVVHLRDGQWVNDKEGPLFKDPYPLGDGETGFGVGKYFLVAHNADRPWNDTTAYGLYLLDEFGNCVCIHDEEDISCWQPMPLKTRFKPPIRTAPRDEQLAKEGLARLVVTDVYYGLDGVERGTIKYLRVNEQMPRPWAARRRWDGDVVDQQHASISWNTNLGLKVQHGIVPVEEDGSAHFVVPADRNIFLQALDENYMEVQRERTYVMYRPGESRSCVGCHEKPGDIPPMMSPYVQALRRAPSRPGPQPGEVSGSRPLHYPTDVQPILDRYCIECHGPNDPKDGLDLSGTPTACFSTSYENILRRKLIPVIGENHPKYQNVEYLPPYSLGSHASPLIQLLREGHEGVELWDDEMVRLTTWVDANGQYYGSYWGRRNLQYKDHPNFRPTPTFEQAISTVAPLPEEER